MKIQIRSALGSVVLLSMLALLSACHDEHTAPPLQLAGFAPTSAFEGDTVVISGANFNADPVANTVAFNGTQTTVVKASKTSLSVLVPSGATNGKIVVTANGKSATSGSDFSVLSSQITGFAPASAHEGDTVVISGSRFDQTISANTVAFNGNSATVIAATKTSLTAIVPPGTTSGKIVVTTSGKPITSASDFTVLTSVYVTANVYESNGMTLDGLFWQDGVKTVLTGADGASSYMSNVVVQGKNVYYARTYSDPVKGSVAAYWKNGVMTNITDGDHDIQVRAICVSPQGDVYLVGRYDDSGAFWKNGVVTLITDFTGSCNINCIAVSGNDVYLGGTDQVAVNGAIEAKYWKNGVGKALSDGTEYASVTGIAVSGGNTHIVGVKGREVVYWKNEVPTILPRPNSDDAESSGIFVVGEDVYISGGVETNEQTTAAYWKNGVETIVQDGIWINNIFVHDGDVYLAGVSKQATPVYWKNQVSVPVTDGKTQGGAFGIAVR